MTDIAPSAIAGTTLESPSSAPYAFGFILPQVLRARSYTDLPPYWSQARDVRLSQTPTMEAMWAAAVARTATKFAAHGYIVKDSEDSTRRVQAAQELLKRADGGAGWVVFATKVMQDFLLTDNGCFIRIRRADEETQTVKLKAAAPSVPSDQRDGDRFDEVQLTRSSPGAKITGLYHLDSQRCTRTGNLTYPVRFMPLYGPPQLLRWDQVLMYADQTSPRAELFGVGTCAASRAYPTISKIAAMEQMNYEAITGGGANKLVLVQGLAEQTLRNLLAAGVAGNQARGFVYWLGTVLGAIPGDQPVTVNEIRLKELLGPFTPKDERDNAYLIYANCIGVPVQDIQPLSGQGLGTGTQTVVLQDASRGVGIAAFLKWWEQTVSDRVLPKTTELSFENEYDTRDQKAKAEVQKLRADERAARIGSGEISPAVARQLAADAGDLAKELLAQDVTPGGQLADDEKPVTGQPNAAAQQLIAGEPTAPPSGGMQTKAARRVQSRDVLALLDDAAIVDRAQGLLKE